MNTVVSTWPRVDQLYATFDTPRASSFPSYTLYMSSVDRQFHWTSVYVNLWQIDCGKEASAFASCEICYTRTVRSLVSHHVFLKQFDWESALCESWSTARNRHGRKDGMCMWHCTALLQCCKSVKMEVYLLRLIYSRCFSKFNLK